MISLQNVTIRAGSLTVADIELTIPQGQYGILLGRTGSGKTTLLEMICGLKPCTQGKILLMNRDVTSLKPSQREIGFVPQDGALFPTLTVEQHLAFALKVRKQSKSVIRKRIPELAEQLELRSLLKRLPSTLSGGEQQRVALGRALSAAPGILCLDEPLSSLDDETRHSLSQLLKSIQRQHTITILHVTHHLEEAVLLGDRIYSLDNQQVRPLDRESLIRQYQDRIQTMTRSPSDEQDSLNSPPPRASVSPQS